MTTVIAQDVSADSRLIREYYACFNERRFGDAAVLFADDAVLEQMPFQRRQQGGAAYLHFARMWTIAFPDAVITIERLHSTAASVFGVGDSRVAPQHLTAGSWGTASALPAVHAALRKPLHFIDETSALGTVIDER